MVLTIFPSQKSTKDHNALFVRKETTSTKTSQVKTTERPLSVQTAMANYADLITKPNLKIYAMIDVIMEEEIKTAVSFEEANLKKVNLEEQLNKRS